MAYLQFIKNDKEIDIRSEVNKKFRITYFGAIGKVNHLQYLLEIAEACQANENINFYVIGEGAELENISSLSINKKLTNITFLPHQSKYQLKEHLQKSDAVFISFKNIDILQTSSPNKFFDGLAAGKLIILNFQGWLKDLIEHYQCGIFVDPLFPQKSLGLIEPFLKDKDLLLKYQENAIKLAEIHFSKEKQIKKLISVIEEKKDNSIIDSSAYILSS
jgi:glycosyltransferase involved in cell wall biosynthesis